MENSQKIVSEFLDKVFCIEKELNVLENYAYDISQLYNRDRFPEQEKLSNDILENLIISVTHETASQMDIPLIPGQ